MSLSTNHRSFTLTPQSRVHLFSFYLLDPQTKPTPDLVNQNPLANIDSYFQSNPNYLVTNTINNLLILVYLMYLLFKSQNYCLRNFLLILPEYQLIPDQNPHLFVLKILVFSRLHSLPPCPFSHQPLSPLILIPNPHLLVFPPLHTMDLKYFD